MDKVASKSADRLEPLSVAASLQKDFARLVLLFEDELAREGIDPTSRPHFAEAREAAERGLVLSKQLAGLLLKGD